MLKMKSLLMPLIRASKAPVSGKGMRLSGKNRDPDNRIGLCAFVDAAVFCEGPVQLSLPGFQEKMNPPGGEVEAMDQDDEHLDALIAEAVDAVHDQPAPAPGVLALKKESLQTMLHLVERRLARVETHGADCDQQRQKLATLREQLNEALSLSDAQETQHLDLHDKVTANRQKRTA